MFYQYEANNKSYGTYFNDLGAVIGYVGKLCLVKRPVIKLAVDTEIVDLL